MKSELPLVKNILRRYIHRSPWAFKFTYSTIRKRPRILVKRDTDVLIEGYPRSANTYAVLALRLGNPGIKIANHMHAPAHVKLALHYRVPAMVLIREPDAAVRSLLIRRTDISPLQALERYVEFYSCLEPLIGSFVLVEFSTVINQFEVAVDELNRRFATNFVSPSYEQQRSDVMFAIASANKRAHGGGMNPLFLPSPHPERDCLKQQVSFVGCEKAWLCANELYSKLKVWAT